MGIEDESVFKNLIGLLILKSNSIPGLLCLLDIEKDYIRDYNQIFKVQTQPKMFEF